MKKSELKPGEAYALGGTSNFMRDRAARVVVVEVAGERRRENGAMAKGIVVTSDAGSLAALQRAAGYLSNRSVQKVGDEYVVDSARYFREPWAEFAATRDLREEAQRVAAADRERRAKRLAELTAELRSRYGVDIERGATPGVRQNPARVEVTFTVDALAEMVERIAGPAGA